MRRVLAFILVILILLPVSLSAVDTKAASAATNNAKKVINALDIMETDKGEISADTAKITRSQYAQLLVNMSTYRDTIAVSSKVSNVSLFIDVEKKHWAAGYIKTAIVKGWMSGYMNGSFKPEKGVTLIEAINGVLKLLGYNDSDFAGNVSGNKMALYASKKLNKGITVSKKTSYLSYDNCVTLFYNTLNATTKEGRVYAETLGYILDSAGELDYLSLINTGTEGPIVADASWTSKLPFSVYGATFYKNEAKCMFTDIDENDVIYYSESFETVWAYDNKVTGTVSAINPDLLNPTSITVAGVEYQFETSTASLGFSSLGTFEKGDIVTLLLGKNGKVAGVLSIDEYNTVITGVVLSVGTHLVKDGKDEYVNTGYVTYVDAGGNKYSQDYNSNQIDFDIEDLIRIAYQDGKATVTEYAMPNFNFQDVTVNSKATFLGTMKFSSNIKILDYYKGAYISVNPIRLADMIVMNNMVYYYDTNANGELTNLVLYNATGDLDHYGIFTGYTYAGSTGTYNYLLDGKQGTVATTDFSNYTAEKGPVGFKYSDGSISSSYQLTEITVSSIGNTTVTSGTTKYPLAENVSAYYLTDGEYVATTTDKLINLSNYKVTAYYDKAITLGGRIRVVVAEKIS